MSSLVDPSNQKDRYHPAKTGDVSMNDRRLEITEIGGKSP